jgi:cytochrome P450
MMRLTDPTAVLNNMAYLQYDLFIWLAFLLTTSLLVRKLLRDSRFRKFAKANNCQPPPYSASLLPWGIDRIWRLVRLTSQGADVLESAVMPSFRSNGWTFQSNGLFGEEPISTAEPENLKAIFATQLKDFVVGDRRAGAFGYMLGKCIFTTDGPFWEHSRALFRPHFLTGQINDLEATERAVQDLFQALAVSNDGPWTRKMDLQHLFLRFTLDTGTEFLFGANVKSQLAAIPGALPSGTNDEVTRVAADKAGGEMNFTEAFHIASVEVTKRAKLQSLYWLADSKKAREAVQYLRKFIDRLVDVTLYQAERAGEKQRTNEQEQEHHEKYTLLKALAKDTQDPVELRDQVLFMLTASRDTTAALLSWMFLMLAKYPSVLQKLRAAIMEEFGTEDAPNKISFNTLKKCHYLRWVMFETLRLYPPGPLNSRVAARHTTLPTGGGPDRKSPIAVRKGEAVNMCVYAMQRRVDLWGEDALEFRPERWEEKKSAWLFLPFSGGPRTCLGRKSSVYF